MPRVSLILEGTYPYVSGGVASCVHQLITLLPDVQFDLVYIGAKRSDLLHLKFRLPANVCGITEVFLFDETENEGHAAVELSAMEREALVILHRALHCSKDRVQASTSQDVYQALQILFGKPRAGQRLLSSLYSQHLYKMIVDDYNRFAKGDAFIDFFFNWRAAHFAVYRLLAQEIPRADLYHSLCTGYAGMLGVTQSVKYDVPLVVTEHGIYSHERSIELADAKWLGEAPNTFISTDEDKGGLRAWWIGFFDSLSRQTYSRAQRIVTLFEGNRTKQLEGGAPLERTAIIPNGLGNEFSGLRRRTPSWGKEPGVGFRIGFVGRVVAIKDVKILIKALCEFVSAFGKVTCQVIGPLDEEPDYAEECIELVAFLGLQSIITFVGKKNVKGVYPDLDCVILTSISEAQPVVILEANYAGIPVVATDVGACRELLEGRLPADRALGPSGLLAPIGNASAIADQLLTLARDPGRWEAMSLAGMKRVEAFYKEERVGESYARLYRECLEQETSPAGLGVRRQREVGRWPA